MSARNPLLTPEEEEVLKEARKIQKRLKAHENYLKKARSQTPEEKERIRQQRIQVITAEKCNEAPYRLWQDPAGNRNQGLHTYPSVPDLSRAA
jgi:hypothetical protein